MTSELDNFKTNEFLRRRKLRLQQVREQSKDVARKIRQRAKVEKLRQVVELDARKQKEYLHRQERLIKQLEEYYSKGIQNVGASHRSASEARGQGDQADKVDLSKQRGKEAAAELRNKRQKILDEQKKLLDRKLQAREAANELSRDKSVAIINKVQSKTIEDTQGKTIADSNKDTNKNDKNIAKNDMATQWDSEEIPNEWEPNVPALSLPKDDNSGKETNNNNVESKSDKGKRTDLFALSEEMPTSLRGGQTDQEERVPAIKSSLTLVSEYLQNRALRLRESDSASNSKKVEDLQSLKQTILRSRVPREGTTSVCHVHDEELVPVPTWQPQNNCSFCAHSISLHKQYNKGFKTASMPVNQNVNCIRTVNRDLLPSPVLRGTSPFRRMRVCPRSISAKGSVDKELKSSGQSSAALKKNSITMYNHSTRDTRDMPYNEERLVIRDTKANDDAYSQAMKETATKHVEKEHQKKIQEIRSKVAMTKQNVEREYKDTISFLNALPKDKGNKPIKTAYMDEQRQQLQKDSRQQKLRQEYRKIEKECSKHNCRKPSQSKSKSPSKDNDDVFESADFQYSWMPVPEGDGNLAIHTIPTTLKEGKSGNTVKFSKVDSYHEYRSRHRHTPPTKDTAQERPNKHAKAVIIQTTSDSESASSDSSTENIRAPRENKNTEATEKLSDAERIIIYKIMDSKVDKKVKSSKLMKDIAKSLTMIEKQKSTNGDNDTNFLSKRSNPKKTNSNAESGLSFEQLDEGVYKAVNEIGDNITSMYFHGKQGEEIQHPDSNVEQRRQCVNHKKMDNDPRSHIGIHSTQWQSGDKPTTSKARFSCQGLCHCGSQSIPPKDKEETAQPSAVTSTSSFKTATNDKSNNAIPNSGLIKLLDDGGEETGKFYIGASGFLKDDAYEVVIQLRKKGNEKGSKESITEKSEDDVKKSNEELLNNDKVSVVTIEANGTKTSVEDVPETSRNKDEHVVTVTTSLPTSTYIPGAKNTVSETVAKVVTEVTNPNSKSIVSSGESSGNAGNNETDEPPNVAEKGVSTSFQDTYAIPIHMPKTNSVPKPGTSTYTQTSISSPDHRPIFFHMSSSTSTAYMSPPEMILPKFMRHDYQLTNEEIYDPRNYNIDQIELTEQQEYSEEYSDCRCKKCTRARKITTRYAPAHRCSKSKLENAGTPPNTVRSGHTENGDINFDNKNMKKVPPLSNKKSRCKCRKCESRKRLNDDNSLSPKKAGHLTTTKSPSCNFVMRLTSSAASSNKHSVPSSTRYKSNLKPIVKNYVDKLLVLNRESLKAVQVIDQECSAVTTPGSSIIEVAHNINHAKLPVENTITLQQISTILKQKMKDNDEKKGASITDNTSNQNSEVCLKKQCSKNKPLKLPRKKTAHKVKSLNISKKLCRATKTNEVKKSQNKPVSSSSSTKECVTEPASSLPTRTKVRSKSSPTPRLATHSDTTYKNANSDTTDIDAKQGRAKLNSKYLEHKIKSYGERKTKAVSESSTFSCHRATLTSTSPDSDTNRVSLKRNNIEIPMSMSTQTSLNVDSEINYMKLAEDKLQNMEKIADLTEKCTQRLSNLAKVLEEVRKNKSLAYSQISSSDTASDTDQKSENIPAPSRETLDRTTIDPNANKIFEAKPSVDTVNGKSKEIDSTNTLDSTDYVPFLSDIPKPVAFKNLNSDLEFNSSSSSSKKLISPILDNYEHSNKSRGKPPPALSRMHLKHGQDYVIPHELSTVVEVDSPMSVKLKSSRNDTKLDVPDTSTRINTGVQEFYKNCNSTPLVEDTTITPDLPASNTGVSKDTIKMSTAESLDNSKIQMLEMKQFNEIMLKPFFSLQEYAKQCNIGALDDGSNLDDVVKDGQINEEFSSLHSDGSLPDVISELLKRNIISEPFKFDTGSNANSTTVSSESTMSVLALSKVRQGKKKASVMFRNKENIGETSDTLSISSNPDLENAFKKLGMGWASSTLKKTKERLALSSSSNTSSSSLSQFKIRSFNQDIPVLVTDTVSSGLNYSNKPVQCNAVDTSKNAEQQTSLSNSMTVKEFLANELANKITFNNKSRNDTEEEFVSLFETKMPGEMKHSSRLVRDEHSIDNSIRSGNNNRARTSTPVQLFKSMTYHSSSSSNLSNGLFSNVDDLSSVKVTSNSMKHSTSDKDDLIIPNFSLRMKRGSSECSKSD